MHLLVIKIAVYYDFLHLTKSTLQIRAYAGWQVQLN